VGAPLNFIEASVFPLGPPPFPLRLPHPFPLRKGVAFPAGGRVRWERKEVKAVRKVLLSLTWTVAALVALAVAAGGSFTW
jgi:hypothetical protein